MSSSVASVPSSFEPKPATRAQYQRALLLLPIAWPHLCSQHPPLGLYRDPVIARNTSASDFRITDLMNADAPVSLYLVVPPSDLARTRPIIRLMLNQIGHRLTESMEFGGKTAYKHRLLLLLDEFPSLGKLEFFETALAFIARYGDQPDSPATVSRIPVTPRTASGRRVRHMWRSRIRYVARTRSRSRRG
mgnify:CR=1 FL=1